jgi:RimJ/RimL family protein N-acetyltransferase
LGEFAVNQDLISDRLILRTAVPEDARVICRELGKWDTARMLATAPYPFPNLRDDEWWANIQTRAFPKQGLWRMLALKGDASRTAIGNVGLCPRDGSWQLGYWLAEDHWGKGLMSEAVLKAAEHVKVTWAPQEIISGAFTDNPGSRRVLEKAGFTYTGLSGEWCEARQAEVPHWNFVLHSVNSPVREHTT